MWSPIPVECRALHWIHERGFSQYLLCKLPNNLTGFTSETGMSCHNLNQRLKNSDPDGGTEIHPEVPDTNRMVYSSEPMWGIEARNAAIANSYFTCAINRVGSVSRGCCFRSTYLKINTTLESVVMFDTLFDFRNVFQHIERSSVAKVSIIHQDRYSFGKNVPMCTNAHWMHLECSPKCSHVTTIIAESDQHKWTPLWHFSDVSQNNLSASTIEEVCFKQGLERMDWTFLCLVLGAQLGWLLKCPWTLWSLHPFNLTWLSVLNLFCYYNIDISFVFPGGLP